MTKDIVEYKWALAATKLLRRFFGTTYREHVGKILVEFHATSAPSAGPTERYFFLSHKIGWPAVMYFFTGRARSWQVQDFTALDASNHVYIAFAIKA